MKVSSSVLLGIARSYKEGIVKITHILGSRTGWHHVWVVLGLFSLLKPATYCLCKKVLANLIMVTSRKGSQDRFDRF